MQSLSNSYRLRQRGERLPLGRTPQSLKFLCAMTPSLGLTLPMSRLTRSCRSMRWSACTPALPTTYVFSGSPQGLHILEACHQLWLLHDWRLPVVRWRPEVSALLAYRRGFIPRRRQADGG